jgi:hypothetical protein
LASNWVGHLSHGHHVTGPGRVQRVAALDVGHLLLGVDGLDDLLAGRRVGQVGVRVDDALAHCGVVGRGYNAVGIAAANQVDIDLDGAAGPARLGLRPARRAGRRRSAVAGLFDVLEAKVLQHERRVDGEPLRGEPVVAAHQVVGLVGQERPDVTEPGVRGVVRAGEVGGALGHPVVARAGPGHPVVVRVGVALRVGLGEQPEDLVAHLVGLVGAREQHVGGRLQRAEDVLDDGRVVGLVEHDGLLVPGVLVDEVRLFGCEVAEDGGRQVVGDVLL